MIVVDTSALVAIALNEAAGQGCDAVLLDHAGAVAISAGTFVEVLIVSGQRGFREAVEALVRAHRFEVVPVTAAMARRIGDAYGRWGKGIHPAALNMGDCYAYALARERDCPLLYVGDDFARTDVSSAL